MMYDSLNVCSKSQNVRKNVPSAYMLYYPINKEPRGLAIDEEHVFAKLL